MTPAARAALAHLVASARRIALDRVDLVQAFTLGLTPAGLENTSPLARCLTRAGIGEPRWRQAGEKEPT